MSTPDFTMANSQPAFPALYLYPLNDTFIPKHIYLPPGQRVKIGRQTNAKTAPGEKNGFFDSKVLSRQHAEVWEENGKIYIRDVKSSNGTFINGDRLSPEGLESDPYDLKGDDIVEFGIDIVGEDNKTIIHHKVAARVLCIFNEHDAQIAARAEQHSAQQQQQHYMAAGSSFNFSGNGPSVPAGVGPNARRGGPANLGAMGSLGASMRPPGAKSGLTFDHILSRLQGELQKSRDTGAELHSLTSAMGEIHDTLGGNSAPHLPPYPHSLPPIRQPPSLPPQEAHPPSNPPMTDGAESSREPLASEASTSSAHELEVQINSAQSSIAQQMQKLENVLEEQERIKDEVRRLRDVWSESIHQQAHVQNGHATSFHDHQDMDGRPREYHDSRGSAFDEDDEEFEAGHGDEEIDGDDDDSDARSVATVVPHELERVDEEDETEDTDSYDDHHADDIDDHDEAGDRQMDEEHEQERRQELMDLGRPGTPEPSNMGLHRHAHFSSSPSNLSTSTMVADSVQGSSTASASPAISEELESRLNALAMQLDKALTLSSSLEAKHVQAQETIWRLEKKVGELEELISASSSSAASVVPAADEVPPVSKDEAVEVSPDVVDAEESKILSMYKASFDAQFASMKEEWEGRMHSWEERLTGLVAEVTAVHHSDLHDEALERMNDDSHEHRAPTPPSPRSPRRRSRSSSRRRRSQSADSDSSNTLGSNDSGATKVDPSEGTMMDHKFDLVHDKANGIAFTYNSDRRTARGALTTPESSVRDGGAGDRTSYATLFGFGEGDTLDSKGSLRPLSPMNMQTAVGVLVLSIAAAAVAWRVKE